MKLTEMSKPASKAKNYVRRGGNKAQVKWKVTLQNGKTKTVSADSRKNIKDHLSPEELIIGIKSAKKVESLKEAQRVPAEMNEKVRARILEVLELAHDTISRRDKVDEKTFDFTLNALEETADLLDPSNL